MFGTLTRLGQGTSSKITEFADVLRQQQIILQQIRTVIIVKRIRHIRLYKDDIKPPLKGRHYLYKAIGDTVANPPQREIDVLLTDHVDGVGLFGEIVRVPKRTWRNFLYPSGLATYPTEDNLNNLEKEIKQRAEEIAVLKKLGRYSRFTLQKLRGLHLPVELLVDSQWVLNKKHIRLSLKKVGIMCTDNCITLPDKDIVKPQEFVFTITVNNAVPVKVRGTVYERPLGIKEGYRPPDHGPLWDNPPVEEDKDLDPKLRDFLTTPAVKIK